MLRPDRLAALVSVGVARIVVLTPRLSSRRGRSLFITVGCALACPMRPNIGARLPTRRPSWPTLRPAPLRARPLLRLPRQSPPLARRPEKERRVLAAPFMLVGLIAAQGPALRRRLGTCRQLPRRPLTQGRRLRSPAPAGLGPKTLVLPVVTARLRLGPFILGGLTVVVGPVAGAPLLMLPAFRQLK